MTSIGIDFGTTNSVVSVHSSTGVEVLPIDSAPVEWSPYGYDNVFPSVMSTDKNGQISFGWKAKNSSEGKFEAVKRMFATQLDLAMNEEGDALAVEEVATMLFAELKSRTISMGGISDPNSAVITVPANSKGRARHRTKLCAGMAGLEVLALINEPTAAAMAYAQRHPEARQLLVFDWGGGTLDVTVLQSVDGIFIEKSSAGLPHRGGLDFDSRLEKIVRESVPGLESLNPEERHLLKLEVELAKIRLSDSEATTLEIPGGRSHRVTRSRFEQEIEPLLQDSKEPILRCLNDLNISPGGLDAVVLVGGTCKIPAVRSLVREVTQLEPDPDINPLTAIGEGAAIAAAILSGDLEDSDFFVSLEHALGTYVFDLSTYGQEFSTLIPRGHALPAVASDTFVPISREQDGVQVSVVEGDPDASNPDFTTLKEWYVPLPETYTEDSDRAIELHYEYDVDGILSVKVNDVDTGNLLFEDDVSYGIATNKLELKKMSDRAKDAVASGTTEGKGKVEVSDPESLKLITQARMKVIPFLDSSEVGPIERAIEELEQSSDEERSKYREALKKELSPYSYLF